MAKFSKINVPVLAICAIPVEVSPYHLNLTDPDLRVAAEAHYEHRNAAKEKQLKSFEEGIPQSRVVRIANANHSLFITNEAVVLREMRDFLSELK